MTYANVRLAPLLQALLTGFCLAAGFHSAAKAELPHRWVELAADGTLSVRVVIAPGAACPAIVADGAAVPVQRRGAPEGGFAIEVCEAAAPAATASLTANGAALPVVAPATRRIAVFGDTGCRVAGKALQDCNDPVAWPFAAIAKAAAAKRPDLVIHVGDYYYRETVCPSSRTGCAGTPHGDNWPVWQADFFDPAAPLLAAAPWVMVRGNHEVCKRGGGGWFRLLDPFAWRSDCVDRTAPYLVKPGGLPLLVADDADADDFLAPPDKVAAHAAQLVPALAGLPPHSWMLMHRPVWSIAQGTLAGLIGNQTVQAAIRGHVPATLDLVLSGHVHDFASYDFGSERAAQLVVGTGGDALYRIDNPDFSGAEIDGMKVRHGFAAERFGYLILERSDAGWDGTLYAPDDAVIARCTLAGRSIDCR